MKKNELKRVVIKNCRICNSDKLKGIIKLSKMPFTDEFLKKEELGNEFLADVEISVCKECGSAQNITNTDMREYYKDYTYTVQSSSFAINFMKTLASRIKNIYFSKSENLNILEIGSGSGEQLLEFKKIGFNVLGIDPSEKLSHYANSIGVKTITGFFDENTKNIIKQDFSNVNAIITSYTFDHIPKIDDVVKNIYRTLEMNGLLIIEVHDLDLIKSRNEFCLFEHEHYTYLNQRTLTQLLNRNNFKVLTFDLLQKEEKRANSLLVVAQKTQNISTKKVDSENEIIGLSNLNKEILLAIKRIDEWLLANRDKKIGAYGAGGRGIMTIAALKNSKLIEYIVDKNPKSKDIYAPKSHLPVYNLNELRRNPVDLILVFSFGYYLEIIEELSTEFNYSPDQCVNLLDLIQINGK